MKQSKNVMSIFLEGTAALYVFIMLGFFPLFYQDNFIEAVDFDYLEIHVIEEDSFY